MSQAAEKRGGLPTMLKDAASVRTSTHVPYSLCQTADLANAPPPYSPPVVPGERQRDPGPILRAQSWDCGAWVRGFAYARPRRHSVNRFFLTLHP